MIEIPFKENKFLQKCLKNAGGTIAIKPNGMPVFKFENKESFKKYQELKGVREDN